MIAAAGITWYVMNQKNQKTGNSSAEVVAWDVDIEEEEPSEEKGILIPGYTSMVMKANTKEQTVSIGNPADNDCIFVIVLKLEDGTKLFESQELKPGEGLENITLDQELEAGGYQAVIEYKCYSFMDFSLLSPLEFFVDPKNVDGRNNKPPAMRVRVDCYTKKLPFRVQ